MLAYQEHELKTRRQTVHVHNLLDPLEIDIEHLSLVSMIYRREGHLDVP